MPKNDGLRAAERPEACELFVARQPMFDRRVRVVGYELLFRAGLVDEADIIDDVAATANVMLNVFTEIGPERILGSRPGWINVSRDFLLRGLASVAPPGLVGLEILEDEVIDDELIETIAALKEKGYRLALDDFEYSPEAEPLLRYINSAFFGLHCEVTSIGQAVALLGIENLQRWATLTVFASIDGKPAELTITALTRGRFCEHASARARGADPSQLFTLGLFSVIEALLDTPIEEVLRTIPFPQQMRDALVAHTEAMVWANEAADPLLGS